MLAKQFTEGMKIPKKIAENPPPIGWSMSEKLDGYRARYDPLTQRFMSRQNKQFIAPEWFIDAMSDIALDGELFYGRDNFQDMGIVRKKIPIDEEWMNIRFCIFDAPEYHGTFKERYVYMVSEVAKIQDKWKLIRKALGDKFSQVKCPVVILKQYKVGSIEQMNGFYDDIIKRGGEGIMLKDPNSLYSGKRSDFMLKYKPTYDAEAIIIGFNDGTGKYSGMLGSFICRSLINNDTHHTIDDNDSHVFSISGMNDEVRTSFQTTHPIDTIISYEHSGQTKEGKPRFARYLRIREDVKIQMESTVLRDKIVLIMRDISKYYQIKGDSIRSMTYSKCISSINTIEDDSEIIKENISSLKGVGPGILAKIMEIKETGTCEMYQTAKDFKDPCELFLGIHGVGVKNAKKLVKAGFITIEDIRKCDNLPGLLTNVQIKGVHWYEDILKRIPRSEIAQHEVWLKERLESIDPTAELTITGSYRRGKSESGDMDILIKTPSVKDASIYEEFLDSLLMDTDGSPYMLEFLSRGKKKFMGICKSMTQGVKGRRIDIMFTTSEDYPFAILYFTGSKDFNTKMREDLHTRGFTLNEYSLKYNTTDKNVDYTFKTEKDIFDFIGYDYVEPEDR